MVLCMHKKCPWMVLCMHKKCPWTVQACANSIIGKGMCRCRHFTDRIVGILKLLIRNKFKIHSWYSLWIIFPDKCLFGKHVKIGLWFIPKDYISLMHVKGKISIQNQIFHNRTLQSWLQNPRCHIDDRWLNGASERICFVKRRLGD